MIDIPTMLERGFGLVSVSDLISLSLHDDILECHFEPFPGVPEVLTYKLDSRTEEGIKEEISQLFWITTKLYYDWQLDIIKNFNRVS